MGETRSAAEKLRLALAHPSLWVICVLLGIIVASPAISSGLLADDIGHREFILATLAGENDRPWWDLFVLIDLSPEELARRRFRGAIPWWASTDVRVALWRPLTAATHYLDYWLWPEQPWLMHLHQLLWHGLACGLAWKLFRRLASSKAAAGAAAIAFSVTHLHLAAVGWLAQRNAVLVLVLVLASLLAHERWRREEWRPGGLLGPACFLAALLCGEMAVAGLGFILAYPLFYERKRLGRGLACLLPYIVVLVGWRLVYDVLGYGATGSGTYVDPIATPLYWLALAPRRLLEFIIYGLGPPGLTDALTWFRGGGAVLVLLGLGAAAYRNTDSRRVLGFCAAGAVASMIPLTTIAAHDRVLVVPTIGTALAFGELLALALIHKDRLLRAGAAFVVLVHYLYGPLLGTAISAYVDKFKITGGVYPVAAGLDDSQLQRQSLIVLHAPTLIMGTLLPRARVVEGLHRPNFCWVLHAETGSTPVATAVDERTLELYDPGGWAHSAETMMLRGATAPLAVGDRVKTLDFEAEILEVEHGRPTRVRFRFRTALDSPTFAFVDWGQQDFEPCSLEHPCW